MNDLRDKLIQAHQDNRFLDAVYRLSLQDGDNLPNVLVDLHNTSTVDVVAAFSTLRKSRTKPDFFLTRWMLEKALSELDANVLSVMECVIHLTKEAGEDLAAGTLIDSYSEFCAKTPSRPQKALELIENNTRELMNLLAPTLSAGARHDVVLYTQKALEFTNHPDLEMRKRAIYSLGGIRYQTEDALVETAIKRITETVDLEDDDHLLSNALYSAFKISTRHTSIAGEIADIFDKALKKGSDITLHMASEIFGLSASKVSPSLLKILITHLSNVDPEHISTLNNIDLGLNTLLSGQSPDIGIAFLEQLLVTRNVKMEALDSVALLLSENKNGLLDCLMTRWLLKGDQALCTTFHKIIRPGRNNNIILKIAPDELTRTDSIHLIFLARKAIGYFFFRPVTATSILLSLFSFTEDEQTVSEITQLIFDPLLLNYPGQVGDYLEEQCNTDNASINAVSKQAIQAYKNYVEDIGSAATLSEHHPPMTNREAFRRHYSQRMHQSIREAEKQSVLMPLVKKSTLLYGTKFIHYIGEPHGRNRRMEMPLPEHSVSVEMPRIHNIDPFGLDYMLRIFKHEQISV